MRSLETPDIFDDKIELAGQSAERLEARRQQTSSLRLTV